MLGRVGVQRGHQRRTGGTGSVAIGLAALAVVAVACTPSGEAWPAAEVIDDSWIAPSASPSAEVSAPAPVDTCAGTPPAPRDPLHAALALDLKAKGSATIEAGQWVDVALRLRNRSSDAAHVAVLPGDGSEVGWREPQVWYSGFVDAGDGCWRPLPTLEVARCGLFDEDWHDDVVSVAPEATRPLEAWIASPSMMLELQTPGRVRLFAHYAYRAGRTGKGEGRTDVPALPPELEGQPAFELVSNPIELTVVQPLVLELHAKPAGERKRVGNILRMADVVTLTLHNRDPDGAARTVVPPASDRLRFEVHGAEQQWPQATWRPEDDALPVHTLAAGERVALLGEAGLAPHVRHHWDPPAPEPVRIRAIYRPYPVDGPLARTELRSAWVELTLD